MTTAISVDEHVHALRSLAQQTATRMTEIRGMSYRPGAQRDEDQDRRYQHLSAYLHGLCAAITLADPSCDSDALHRHFVDGGEP